jgi:signal transduction histidine kinase
MNSFITSAQVTLPRLIHGWANTAAQHRLRAGAYVLIAQVLLVTFIISSFSAGPLLVVATLVAMAPAAVILTLWIASEEPTALDQPDADNPPFLEEPPQSGLEDDLQEEPSAQPSISDQIEAVADRVLDIIPYIRLLVFLFKGDDDEELIFDRELPATQPEDAGNLQSGLTVPVNLDGSAFGRMVIFSDTESAYSSSDLESLEEMAGELGPVLTVLIDRRVDSEAIDDATGLIVENEFLKDLVEDLQTANGELSTAVEDLEWRNSQIQSSRTRLVEAHESAKRSVAEELHGAVQTKLYAVWIRLQDMERKLEDERPEESSAIATIATDIDNIREEDIRLLSHRLHPSVIRLGLASALRSLRDNYENVLPIDLDISERFVELEPAGQSRLPKNLRLGLYRIAELAIGNVLKHAHASNCTIELDLPEPMVIAMKITDDGVGFSEDARVPQGIGLATMDDYADSLDGHLTVTSLPGKGTSIEVMMQVAEFEGTEDSDSGEQAIGMLVDMHWAEPHQKTAT